MTRINNATFALLRGLSTPIRGWQLGTVCSCKSSMFLLPLKRQFGRHFVTLFLTEQHLEFIKGKAIKGHLQNPAANFELAVRISFFFSGQVLS